MLDVMLDAELVGGAVSDLEGPLAGRTYRACKIDIEITVEVSMAEPAPEKDGNSSDLAMTLDDGHDHLTCHGSKSALKKSASAPVVEGKAWVQRAFERRRRPTVCGGFRFART